MLPSCIFMPPNIKTDGDPNWFPRTSLSIWDTSWWSLAIPGKKIKKAFKSTKITAKQPKCSCDKTHAYSCISYCTQFKSNLIKQLCSSIPYNGILKCIWIAFSSLHDSDITELLSFAEMIIQKVYNQKNRKKYNRGILCNFSWFCFLYLSLSKIL